MISKKSLYKAGFIPRETILVLQKDINGKTHQMVFDGTMKEAKEIFGSAEKRTVQIWERQGSGKE